MFLNPIWSILVLCVPIAIYWFVIRPRLKVRFTELYDHIDSFWGRVWARTYAFRTFWLATLTAVLTAAPDLLVKVSGLDFSFLPQPWPMYTSIFFTIAVPLMKAFETKPDGKQA